MARAQESISPREWLNPMVVTCSILLSGCAMECRLQLLSFCQAVKEHREAVYGEAIYLLPKTVLQYCRLTDDHASFREYAQTLQERFDFRTVSPDTETAYRAGAYISMRRLSALWNLSVDKWALGDCMASYQRTLAEQLRHVTENVDACQWMPILLSAYFDFVPDNERERVRNVLASLSFFVPKDKRCFLYSALCHMEAHEIVFTALLESGSPTSFTEATGILWTIMADLCGVDFVAMNHGIYHATSEMPFGISYQLVIPYHSGVMHFSRENDYDMD